MITDYYKMAKKSSTNIRKRKRKSTKSKSKQKKAKRVDYKKRIYRKIKKFNKKRAKLINVDANKQVTTHSYVKKAVNYKKQKKINNKFNQGYSPFLNVYTNYYQETTKTEIDRSKYVWFNKGTLQEVYNYALKATSVGTTLPTQTPGQSNGYLINGQDMSIYISRIKYRYEISNPSNYDQTIVIYDLVCKNDTISQSTSCYYNATADNSINYFQYGVNTTQDYDPISLMRLGSEAVQGKVPSNGDFTVTDPSQMDFYDIKYTPTMSYPFNIYWKVARKHMYTLQPGSSLTHVFTYRPKQILTRGYLGYKYASYLQQANNTAVPIGIKDITAGSLFKYWGQLAGSGEDTNNSGHNEVINLSGAITIKCDTEIKWYRMDPKFTYIYREKESNNAANLSVNNMEVINDTTIKPVQTADNDNTNNIESNTS